MRSGWRWLVGASLVGVSLGSTTPALGQSVSSEVRAFVSVNASYQAPTVDFFDNVTFSLFVEPGDMDVDYTVDAGLGFDLYGGVPVWRGLAVGAGVSRFRRDVNAGVRARLPHPFRFDRHRRVSGQGEGLERTEVAIHVPALWMAPVSDQVEVAVFGGPTFFRVQQHLVVDVEFDHAFPFDSATFAGASTVRQSESKLGFHLGVDASVFFSKHLGAGGMIRFSRATMQFESADSDVVTVDVGGVHVAGGLRLRF